jgi:hypothetical protein
MSSRAAVYSSHFFWVDRVEGADLERFQGIAAPGVKTFGLLIARHVEPEFDDA